ncbi:TauD/TfdA family dioxygenase [Streptomyces sp. MUSC 14]|uniref:TauD/TfdA family dioxygenase n=1 Tax=Streptomyces sp. MUSC 14 TaxID=1354889 RepID=UPI0009A123FA|nr:TauD/TfdA family dioxygenase [Streptomyces sp. MUSC 14]
MAMLLEDLVGESRRVGWASSSGTIAQVQREAAMLGWKEVPTRKGGPAISTLRPVDPEGAEPNSLSARYGKGAQPLHTDGAHLPEPPDVVVLVCEATSTTPTRLWDRGRPKRFISVIPDFLRHGVFLVNSGNDSFFTTALAAGRMRYDPGCMMPCDARARQVAHFFIEAEGSVVEHEWSQPGQLLVIDNRKALHARASAVHDPQRELQRLSFHLNRETS